MTQSNKKLILKYKAEIEMIKSHMNISNRHMLEEMIENRINKIKQLNCGFCEENCNRPDCFTNQKDNDEK